MKFSRILAWAVLCLFCVMTAGVNAADNKTQKTETKYHHVRPDKLVQYINSIPGPKAVIIYASWCPACRHELPGYMDLARVKPKSVIMISIDKSYSQLSTYMKRYEPLPVQMIVANEKYQDELQTTFNTAGIGYTGRIPFVTIFDGTNTVAQEGYLPADLIAENILD